MQKKKRLALLSGLTFALLLSAGACGAASNITEMDGDPAVKEASPGSTGKAHFASPDTAKSGGEAAVTFAPPTEAQKQLKPAQDSAKTGSAVQTGISLKTDASGVDLGTLRWVNITDQRRAAHFTIESPGAGSVRAGLIIKTLSGKLPANLVLHFQGGDSDIFETTGNELTNNQLFWSPVVVGDRLTVELVLPAGLTPQDLQVSVPQLSYFPDSIKDARAGYTGGFGRSGSCEVDKVCAAQNGTPAYDDAARAVAKMIFTTSSGDSFICTGSLLNNSNTPKRQLFWSAAHCLADQEEADTLQTVWFYSTTQCAGDVSTVNPRVTVLTGGATLLFRNASRDTLLVELKRTPPAGVFYQGWNATRIDNGVEIDDLHHPQGDALKYSRGLVTQVDVPYDNHTHLTRVQWPAAVVEGGSSGSGLLTLSTSGNYQLRGGLYGGPSFCRATTVDRQDYFSDFSGVFSEISRYFTP